MKNKLFFLLCLLTFLSLNTFSQTALQWARNYNDPINQTDRIIDADFDAVTGSIYVTGVSDSTVGFNYVTIKYSSAGQIVWRKRFVGPQFQDSPNAIRYDPVNNAVYVTGKSKGATTNFDWLTIRYNAATGAIVWSKTYNGTQNGNDEAIDLDIDATGNIYVLGNVLETCADHLNTILIKYSPIGTVAWTNYINSSYCYYDELAYKVAVNGNKVVVIYNEKSSNGLNFTASAVGYFISDGSCTKSYCYSYTIGTTTPIPGYYSIDFDGLGNVYIAGLGLSVAKLNTDVYSLVWKRSYIGARFGWAKDIIVDQNNYNVYVTGYLQNSLGTNDIYTIKYNSSGDSLWTKKYYGAGNGDDMGLLIAKDNLSNPNIYVAGYTTQSNGNELITTIKYNNSGSPTWSVNYGCSANDNIPVRMFRDPSDMIYLAGTNNCNNTYEDFLTLKYCTTAPPKPEISQNGNVLQSNSATGNQWFNQTGLIAGATSQNYTVISNGNYYVITSNGCYSEPSNTINLIVDGIEDQVNNRIIKVYPNPVSNELTLEIKDCAEETDFEIINMTGTTIYKGKFAERTVVNTSNFTPGVYYIKIGNGRAFEFKKIVK